MTDSLALYRRRLGSLPLARATHNRRSFVALDNLVDLLITCIDHPAAANQTFSAQAHSTPVFDVVAASPVFPAHGCLLVF